MIRKLVHFAIRQRMLTILMALAIIIGGVFAFITLKIEAYPDVADTEVDVITKYPGKAAAEVEEQVTIPIERALNAVPRIINRRSRTIFGLSIVRLTFEEGTDDYFARNQVIEKLRDADIPDGLTPGLAPLSTPVGEIYRYMIEGPSSYSQMDLRTLQDWVVIPKLLQAKGIADIQNFGGLVKQYSVLIDPLKLQKYGLTATSVQNAIQANNSNTGGRIITRGSEALSIRGIGRIHSPKEIESIVLLASPTTGTPVLVRDVATIEVTPLPPEGILGYSDNSRGIDVDDGVQGLVLMRRGENPSEVIKGLKEKLEEVQQRLPEGVKLISLYDRTELVDNTLDTVSHTVLEGVTIVVLILLFFLGNVRAALLAAITIPLSMLGAFILMKSSGISANLLSLGAIDFGIIVDGAVVIVDSIMRKLSETPHEERERLGILKLIVEATQEVDKEIFFSVVIIILAYLPMFTLTRVEGKLFSPMAFTFSFAVGGSLVLALTLIPSLATYLFRSGKVKEWKNPLVRWLERFYDKTVSWVLDHSVIVIGAAAILVAGSIFLGSMLGTEFLPELDEGAIVIRTVMPAGISLDQASKIPPIVREVCRAHPEVRAVISQLGRNDDGTDPYGLNRIETHLELTKYSTWPAGMNKEKLLLNVKEALESRIPGATFSFSQPILDNVTEAVTGSASDLAVLVNGDNLNVLRPYADTILRTIKQICGATESGIEEEGSQSQLVIKVDRDAAAKYGINVRDIEDVIELAVAGKPVSSLYEGERKFDIVIRYQAGTRSTVDAVAQLQVISPSGQRIPLSDVCDISIVDGETIIAREDGHHQIGVRTNIRGRDQGSFVAEAQKQVAAGLHLQKGYTLDWGGQFENLTRAKNHLIVIIPITLFLITAVLFMMFRSVKYALMVFINVPLALVGGIGALMIRHINFSVSAGVGFISLFGISIMSGVLLISRVNKLRFVDGMELRHAVHHGAMVQFRARLMVMTLAMLGLIPAMLATGIGSDIQRPLATVIVGGLASSLILTLVVVPSIYYAIERRAHPDLVAAAVEMAEIEEQRKAEERKKQHEDELRHLND
ncbi:MAG TPA: CusA/CzcA family heavy metal efflux RND transporter [Candidatus Kapabacteria bacterium]|nr:CusA/CzcA family heavy metal efflux RND transporter [Candidatus Kapabacteria bacterium]